MRLRGHSAFRLALVLVFCLSGAPVLADDDDLTGNGFPPAAGGGAPIEMGEDDPDPVDVNPDRAHSRVMRLSLAEAVKMGMQANLTLRDVAYDSPIAHQGCIAADAAFDDLLTAELEFGTSETPNQFAFNFAETITDDSVRASAGVSRRLRSGGSIALLYRLDRVDTDSPVALFNPSYTQNLGFEARQPILRGAGDVALSDLRRAQNGVVAARAGFDTGVQEVLLGIVGSYWELSFAYENLAAKESSVTVAAEVLAEANARLDAEKGTQLDVAQARAGLERRRSDALQAENLLGTVSDQLLALIMPFGPERVNGAVVQPSESLRDAHGSVPSRRDGELLVQEALRGRPEIQISRADIANRSIDMFEAADSIRPQLDAFGRVGTAALDNHFGQSWEDLISGEAFSASVGVQFSMFVGQRAAHAGWRAAGWARRQALIRYKELENQIVVEVRAAVRDMRTADAQITAGQEEVKAATEDLNGERDKLLEGISTPFLVLQKEDDLRDARTRLARAAADIRISRAALWRSVGSMAKNYGAEPPEWAPCRDCR